MKTLKEIQALDISKASQIVDFITDSGQWTPLFNDKADVVFFTNVVVKSKATTVNGNVYWNCTFTDDAGNVSAPMSMTRGANDKDTVDIGVFFAIRDHEGRKTSFKKGETYRIFAY